MMNDKSQVRSTQTFNLKDAHHHLVIIHVCNRSSISISKELDKSGHPAVESPLCACRSDPPDDHEGNRLWSQENRNIDEVPLSHDRHDDPDEGFDLSPHESPQLRSAPFFQRKDSLQRKCYDGTGLSIKRGLSQIQVVT